MWKFLATYLIGQSTWTVGFAMLACFVVGALLKATSPDSIAIPVVAGLAAGIVVGLLVWRVEAHGRADVPGAWRLLK